MDTECEHGTRNGNRCEDCEALALLHAEIDRLRAAIERAPHGHLCPATQCGHFWDHKQQWCTREAGSHGNLRHAFYPRGECTCWKAAALKEA